MRKLLAHLLKAFKLSKEGRNLSRFIGIDARYKASYRITKKQLEYLAQRVKKLQRLIKVICKKKIESF
jgi:predicted transcriptional regulator